MATLNYPDGLPNPVKAIHTPKDRTRNTDLVGSSLYENFQADYTGTMDIEFFLTADQVAAFFAWWQNDLTEGGRWFNCTWPALRPGLLIAQFVGEPAWDHVYMGACRVATKVQIRGASQLVKAPVPPNPLNPFVVLNMRFENDLLDDCGHVFTSSFTPTYVDQFAGRGVVIPGASAGLGGDAVISGLSIDWALQGDFCLEAVGRINSNIARPRTFIRLANGAGDTLASLGADSNGSDRGWFMALRTTSSTSAFQQVDYLEGAWPYYGVNVHLCIEREGDLASFYRNGLLVGTATAAYRPANADTAAYIGNSRASFIDAMDGDIAWTRLTNHVRYGAPFTPPTQDQAWP